MKKYLITEIAPITPQLLERFKASGELIWTGDFIQVRYDNSTGAWRDDQGYTDDQPTHYLPDGLPDPSAAVEVFESEVFITDFRDEFGDVSEEKVITIDQVPGMNLNHGDRVIIMRTPTPTD
jgi:hypothetical protein